MQMFRQDLRISLRMLLRSPGFTVIAVLTLALGIGANTAIFSVVNAVLLRPLAFKDSASLVNIWGKFEKQGLPLLPFSGPEYFDLLSHNDSFSQIAGYAVGGNANLTRSDAEPVQVRSANATASLFPLLGVNAAVGRTFAEDEDKEGHFRFVLLSNAFWRSQFAGDPSIVGKTIQLNGQPYNVVGVLPKEFSLGRRQDLWTPLVPDRDEINRGSPYMHVVGRLKPGVTMAQAGASMKRFADDLRSSHTNFYNQQGPDDFGMFVA